MPLQSYRYSSSYRHVVNPTRDPDHISPPPPPTLSFFRSAQMHPNNNKIWRNTKNRRTACPGQHFGTYDKSPYASTSTPSASAGLGQSKIIICRTGQWTQFLGTRFSWYKKLMWKPFFDSPTSHIKIIKPCAAAVLRLLFDICRQILIFVQPFILFL